MTGRSTGGGSAGGLASNGWALGGERTESGGGMVLANPHFPWTGERRLWESHLTIPGELDVYGVSLLGTPGVQIGFNRDVAWTHTVSDGKRLTMYELALVPGRPTAYRYDGRELEMTAVDHRVKVKQKTRSVTDFVAHAPSSRYCPCGTCRAAWTIPRPTTTATQHDNDDCSPVTHGRAGRPLRVPVVFGTSAHPVVNTMVRPEGAPGTHCVVPPNLSPKPRGLASRRVETRDGAARRSSVSCSSTERSGERWAEVDGPATPAGSVRRAPQLPARTRANANDTTGCHPD